MMGNKTLKEIRAEVRAAYAKAGIDPESWLEQRLCRLQGKPAADPRELETLLLLRQALAEATLAKPRKARKRVPSE